MLRHGRKAARSRRLFKALSTIEKQRLLGFVRTR
jgi:hypothetical protein